MSWFFENPWPPIIACVVLAAVFVYLWSGRKQTVHLGVAAGLILLAMMVFAVERTVVTDSERVEHSIHGLAQAFQRKDVPVLMDYFSVGSLELQSLVKNAAEQITVQDDLRISDLEVSMHSQNTRAVARFRASATVGFEGQA